MITSDEDLLLLIAKLIVEKGLIDLLVIIGRRHMGSQRKPPRSGLPTEQIESFPAQTEPTLKSLPFHNSVYLIRFLGICKVRLFSHDHIGIDIWVYVLVVRGFPDVAPKINLIINYITLVPPDSAPCTYAGLSFLLCTDARCRVFFYWFSPRL